MATPERSVLSEGYNPSPNSSFSSTFVRIPHGDRFIVNKKLVKLPFIFLPAKFNEQDNKYFQSREKELREIYSHVLSPQGDNDSLNYRSFLIKGLGGAGKTELAFRFITRYKEHFDAIFFLNADSESRLSEQYSKIAWDLGLVDDSDVTNQEHCSECFRTWLGDPVKGVPETQKAKTFVKWLLVFDNAKSDKVVGKFWPGGQHGHILLTSRSPLLASSELYIHGSLQLKGFPVIEGAQFLRIRAQDDKSSDLKTDSDAQAITKWVQGLPMALDQLGRIIWNDHLSISKFRELYPTKSDIYDRFSQDSENDNNIITAWNLNGLYERHRDAFALLSIIAMLDSETIEYRTLEPRPTSLNFNGTPTTKKQHLEYRKHLIDASFIGIDRDSQKVSAHDIVQDVMINMTVRYGLAQSAFKDAVHRVAEQWPFLNRNYVTGTATRVDRWKDCSQSYPHIVRLMAVHVDLRALGVRSLASLELAELLLEAVQ